MSPLSACNPFWVWVFTMTFNVCNGNKLMMMRKMRMVMPTVFGEKNNFFSLMRKSKDTITKAATEWKKVMGWM